MSNNLKVTDKLAAVALDIFKQTSHVAQHSTRSYEQEFNAGAKIGDNCRIKIPSRYALQTGNNRTNPQAIEQQTRNLTLNQNKYVSLNLTSQELAVFTGTDAKAQQEILEQPIANLARYVDTYCFGLMNSAANATIQKLAIDMSGNATDDVTVKDVARMNSMLGSQLAPYDRVVAASPFDLASIQRSQLGLFNPSKDVSDAYHSGMAGSGLGFGKWIETVATGTQTVGTATTATTSAAVASDGLVAIPISSLSGFAFAGQALTVSGVYMIDPQTLTGIPQLATMTLSADAPAGSTTLYVVNPLYSAGGSSLTLANVSALPANGATVTFIEAVTAKTTQVGKTAYNLVGWTKKAFALAFMHQPDDLAGAEARSITEDGVSIRIIKQYQSRSNSMDLIADLQFGALVTRPEWIVTQTGVFQ